MVVINTKQDLIHARHIYTNPWACEVGGYFAADMLILFYIQWMKVNKDLRQVPTYIHIKEITQVDKVF